MTPKNCPVFEKTEKVAPISIKFHKILIKLSKIWHRFRVWDPVFLPTGYFEHVFGEKKVQSGVKSGIDFVFGTPFFCHWGILNTFSERKKCVMRQNFRVINEKKVRNESTFLSNRSTFLSNRINFCFIGVLFLSFGMQSGETLALIARNFRLKSWQHPPIPPHFRL